MEISYIGEHLLPGKIGHLLTVLALVSALIGAIGYFIAAKNDNALNQWRSFSRTAIGIHQISVFGIIATLLYMLFNGFFEYNYVWEHSNTEMPMRYILSSFWEGQEGSFLLWLFWNAVLSIVLIRTSGKWEAPVLAVFALVQVFLVSMVLGTTIGDFRFGSSPFVLLRDNPEFAGLPFLQHADYLARIDGRGLNPLLQNYWMTIHPPTLFLGFASTLIPFSYAIAGMWKQKFTEWLKPALPWTFFGVMILGTGVLMGGAWAYEALSFGGFWAWDPVENSSLVPWLILVGAAHVMMVQKNRGQSLIMTFVLSTASFILVLYSTFLTRSGILGDSSVHAFTDLGMSGQLLIYLLTFMLLSIVLLIINWKKIPKSADEENLYSREFWMFIGALVLVISSFQIIFTTSIPVINKIFGSNMAPPTDAIAHYNSFQIPLAIIVSIIIGITQFLKYRRTDPKKFYHCLLLPFALTIVSTVVIAYFMQYTSIRYLAMLFATLFLLFANAVYWFDVLKGKFKIAGASVAHIGFGMILLGAFLSTSKTQNISVNSSRIDLEQLGKQGDFSNSDNIMLMKGDTLPMGDYLVTYKNKRREGVNVFYQVDYLHRTYSGAYKLDFSLFPRVQTNPRMGNVAEPDTKHFFYKDIYTFVTYAEIGKEEKDDEQGYKLVKTEALGFGDTLFASSAFVVLKGFTGDVDKEAKGLRPSDIALGADLSVIDISGKSREAQALYAIRGQQEILHPVVMDDLGLKLVLSKILPDQNKAEIKLYEKNQKREFIVLKALVFPWINILWAGCLVMIIGTIMAIRRRLSA